jgi:glutamine amidotransferase
MIGIIDYGIGNIQAFANIYRRLNISVKLAQTPQDLVDCDKLILPGVGAFDWAMQKLIQSGLRDHLDDLVLNQNRPILGVCVGLQMMARRSDEGELEGLGWLDAEVRRFDDSQFQSSTHLPHMGWNDVRSVSAGGLFTLIDAAQFYFLHSYYFLANNPAQVLATTDYGGSFTSAAQRENICGVQFHPEKSHQSGVQLLKNFAEIELC